MKMSSRFSKRLSERQKMFMHNCRDTYRDKRKYGPFTRGETKFRPNEVAIINMPDKYREGRINQGDLIFKAPYFQNGRKVRVVGLWSPKKFPYRVWPMEMSEDDMYGILSWLWKNPDAELGNVTFNELAIGTPLMGGFIPPEFLNRAPIEEQDKIFLDTAAKYMFSPEVVEDGLAGVDQPETVRRKHEVKVRGIGVQKNDMLNMCINAMASMLDAQVAEGLLSEAAAQRIIGAIKTQSLAPREPLTALARSALVQVAPLSPEALESAQEVVRGWRAIGGEFDMLDAVKEAVEVEGDWDRLVREPRIRTDRRKQIITDAIGFDILAAAQQTNAIRDKMPKDAPYNEKVKAGQWPLWPMWIVLAHVFTPEITRPRYEAMRDKLLEMGYELDVVQEVLKEDDPDRVDKALAKKLMESN